MTSDRTPQTDAAKSAKPSGGLAMLLVFPLFVVIITLAIVGVGASDTWLVVIVAMLAVAALTGVVSLMTARLLADDPD